VDDGARLLGISEASLNLVLWRRSVPAELTRVLAAWAWRAPHFERDIDARSYDLGAALVGLDDPMARGWLAADLAHLIGILAACSQAERLRVFFGIVRGDQCRKFHIDYLRFRLVTTYLGPGTEWLPDEAVDRAVLDHPPECPCDANRKLVRAPHRARRARAGDVLLSKGVHAVGRARAFVHRSPPLEGTGAMRLVLIASSGEMHAQHAGDEP
jgi:hypothetical protein